MTCETELEDVFIGEGILGGKSYNTIFLRCRDRREPSSKKKRNKIPHIFELLLTEGTMCANLHLK